MHAGLQTDDPPDSLLGPALLFGTGATGRLNSARSWPAMARLQKAYLKRLGFPSSRQTCARSAPLVLLLSVPVVLLNERVLPFSRTLHPLRFTLYCMLILVSNSAVLPRFHPSRARARPPPRRSTPSASSTLSLRTTSTLFSLERRACSRGSRYPQTTPSSSSGSSARSSLRGDHSRNPLSCDVA